MCPIIKKEDPPVAFLWNKNTNEAELVAEKGQSQGSVPNVSSHSGQGYGAPLCGPQEVTQHLWPLLWGSRRGGNVLLNKSLITRISGNQTQFLDLSEVVTSHSWLSLRHYCRYNVRILFTIMQTMFLKIRSQQVGKEKHSCVHTYVGGSQTINLERES